MREARGKDLTVRAGEPTCVERRPVDASTGDCLHFARQQQQFAWSRSSSCKAIALALACAPSGELGLFQEGSESFSCLALASRRRAGFSALCCCPRRGSCFRGPVVCVCEAIPRYRIHSCVRRKKARGRRDRASEKQSKKQTAARLDFLSESSPRRRFCLCFALITAFVSV